jgi:hypothetical protein
MLALLLEQSGLGRVALKGIADALSGNLRHVVS